MALKQIERQHVLAALADFDRQGTDKILNDHGFDLARSYLLVHEGKEYPSKAVVGVAHGYAVPAEGAWGPGKFSGGQNVVGRLLNKLGFEVRVTGEASRSSPASPAADAPRAYWWVNHKQTYAQEVGGGYLWSPVTRSDGGHNEFYENMKRVRPGPPPQGSLRHH